VILLMILFRAAPRSVPALTEAILGALFFDLSSMSMLGDYQRLTAGSSLNFFGINVMSSCYNLLHLSLSCV